MSIGTWDIDIHILLAMYKAFTLLFQVLATASKGSLAFSTRLCCFLVGQEYICSVCCEVAIIEAGIQQAPSANNNKQMLRLATMRDSGA